MYSKYKHDDDDDDNDDVAVVVDEVSKHSFALLVADVGVALVVVVVVDQFAIANAFGTGMPAF
jgi:hypothetical protein